jgi:alkylhydroperoxidase family enzyme
MPRIKFCNPEIERAYLAETDTAKKVNLAFAGVMGHIPKANKYLVAVKAAAKHDGTLGHRLVELVRIRMAYHTQCRTCMTLRFKEGLEDGITQQLVCSLEKPEEAADLTDRERKAREYTDKFALNWLTIDPGYFDGMRKLFTEAEIVQLGLVCALHLGTGRLMASFAVTEELPETMQGPSGDHRYKPWEVDIDALVFDPLPDDVVDAIPETHRKQLFKLAR